MYSGIAGLKAFKSSLDVIGNNIANVNTISYKAGRVTFKEALSQTIAGATSPSGARGGTNPVQVGLGVTVGAIDNNMAGGSPQSTGRQTDLMIEGGGYFVMGDGSSKVYTRDGAFSLDAGNNLVSSSTGLKVLGWTADPLTGEVDSSAQIAGSSGINIPVGLLSTARATSQVDIGGNLNNTASIGDTRSIESQVYDSLGVLHKLTIEFTKAANDPVTHEPIWNYDITCPEVSATVPVVSGAMNFDTNGHSKVPSIDIDLTLAVPNGSVVPLSITLDTSGISSISGDYTISQRNNDGLALGTLESYTIGRDGIITGTFTNGSTRALAQISIAQFTNAAGLSKLGNNTLTETPNSGSAQLGVAGVGGRGLISSGFLESSNVDLAQEFANMIIAQRGFQANSRIITASDDVLQDLVTMKR
jgi:flagellar hook protein FlgE